MSLAWGCADSGVLKFKISSIMYILVPSTFFTNLKKYQASCLFSSNIDFDKIKMSTIYNTSCIFSFSYKYRLSHLLLIFFGENMSWKGFGEETTYPGPTKNEGDEGRRDSEEIDKTEKDN